MRAKPIAIEESGLRRKEYQLIKRFNTPAKVQDFLNTFKFDFREGDKIDRSVAGTLKARKTDCAGGAILAAATLWIQGREPLLLDLKTAEPDFDHLLALFKEGKYWGAISKTNHGVLRYREPIYESVRELAMSYFHEYFLYDGKKTLRSISAPLDLSRFGPKWFTDKETVVDIIHKLDNSTHKKLLTPKQIRNLRRADEVEIKAGKVVEYKDK